MPKTGKRFVLAQLACVLLLAGCGGNPVPAAGREKLTLGVAGVADAKNSGLTSMIRGVELAVEEYNKNPDSRYEIEMKQLGTKAVPGEGGSTSGDITKTERLIGVVGPFAQQDVADLGPAFEGAGVPFLVPSLTSTAVPLQGWRSFRRLNANDRQEGVALAEHAMRKVKGAIALVAEDSDPGNAFAAGAKERLDAGKRAPSRTETLEPKKAPANLATSLVQGGPEAILFGGGGETAAALLEALRKAGFKGLFVASHQLRDMNPNGLGINVASSSPGADLSDPGVQNFAGAYRKKFQTAPAPYALESYEGAIMLLDAVEEVGGEPRNVTDFLQQNRKFAGDSKSYAFDGAGELTAPPAWIYESLTGNWKLLGRSDRLATARG